MELPLPPPPFLRPCPQQPSLLWRPIVVGFRQTDRPSFRFQAGRTLLHTAAAAGQLAVTKELLARKAGMEFKDKV